MSVLYNPVEHQFISKSHQWWGAEENGVLEGNSVKLEWQIYQQSFSGKEIKNGTISDRPHKVV